VPIKAEKIAPPKLVETTLDGAETQRWYLNSTECPSLREFRIARVGIDISTPPYTRVRELPGGSFIMACHKGKGRMLLEGRWQDCAEGDVCFAPPRVLNAFYATSRSPWAFVWVRFDEPVQTRPLVTIGAPVRQRGGNDLRRAVEGLREEHEGRRETRITRLWVELIFTICQRLADPVRVNERLWEFWQLVNADLAKPWDLDSLAKAFHSSKEHLRRLCRRELGRSPIDHLAHLRMEKARQLLETNHDKIAVVAEQCGYANSLIFIRAFKRITGTTPGEYRRRL
jgi:AraC-like DNA-binding protein